MAVPTFANLVIPTPEAGGISIAPHYCRKAKPMTTNQSIPVYHGAGK
jgi:hypothetical protein